MDYKTVSLSDQVFEHLESNILSGKYQRGEIITELQLCSELGVSRTPIREALRRHIFGTRPPGAVSGHFAQEIELRPVYTRAGRERSAEDLCLLVTGLVPVMYTDGEGKLVKG